MSKKKHTKWDIEKARKLFKDNGCELLEKVYINCFAKMRYICSCEFKTEAEISLNNFKRGSRCYKCGIKKIGEKNRHTLKKVKKIFEDGGCYLLEDIYKTCDIKMWFICNCRRLAQITLTHFQRGVRCRKCFIERISGKNSCHYRFDKTDEERIRERDYPGYKKWRKNVYERDNYSCIICGDNRGGNLIAHHLESYDINVDLRLVVFNGITIDENCHDLFHNIYGYGKNTGVQFAEFLKEHQEELILKTLEFQKYQQMIKYQNLLNIEV